MKIVSASALALTLAALSTPAFAGRITTPTLFTGAGNQIVCIANNASSSTVTMTVRIIGMTSDDVQTCTLSPNDRDTCQAFLDNQSGYCRISVSGMSNSDVREKLRGVLLARSTQSPFAIDTSVDAR